MHACTACRTVPQTDDDVVLAFMLTDSFIQKDKLIAVAQMIRSGQRIEVPPSVRVAVLTALQGARAQRPAQQQGNSANELGTTAAVARSMREMGNVSVFSAKGLAIVAAVAAVLFLIFHPWPNFQWASFRDKVSSYDGFVSRFPSSDYTSDAKERIRVLREDEIWSAADGLGQIETLRSYIRVYHDGKYLDEAKKQIATITDNQWVPISYSRSEAEIRRYLKSYPETSKLAAAEARIQELYNDFDWVKEQDTLEHYRRFATRYPAHSQMAAIEKRIIDLEVKEIAAGEYGEMPRAQALSYGGSSTEVEVENKTRYELTVRYSGPESKKLVIPVAATRSVTLVPGAYKVAASVNAANVTNYYGSDYMEGGRYSSSFYIETSFGGTSYSVPSYSPSRKRR
jgi:outer membrane protein assembly factor BamD (BamD/ComL family)